MRMGDNVYRFNVASSEYGSIDHLKHYVPVLNLVSQTTSTDTSKWNLYQDGHQISTRDAGKSSCEFLAANFKSLDEALDVIRAIQTALPNVNLEMFVAPNGRQDMGDGVGSYDRSERDKENIGYIQDEGYGVTVLVDVQNVKRHMQQAASPAAPSPTRIPIFD